MRRKNRDMNTTTAERLQCVADALWLAPTALLLAWCFPPHEWTLLAWVTLIPFGIALAKKEASVALYAGAYFSGLAFHLLATDWLRTSSQGEGLSGSTVSLWIVSGQIASVVWPAALWFGRRLERKTHWPIFLLLPVVWISGEFLRMQLGWVASKTPCPWLQIGTTQVERTHIIQIADLGGAWGVGLLVAIVNGAFADLLVLRFRPNGAWQRWRRGIAACATVAVGVTGAFVYGEYRLQQTETVAGPRVCLMPTLLSAQLPGVSAPLAQVYDALRVVDSPLKRGFDLALWSEDANVIVLQDIDRPLCPSKNHGHPAKPTESAEHTIQQLEKLARLVKSKIVIGVRREQEDRKFNSLAVIDPQDGYEGCCDKNYLVPWSEFTPWNWPDVEYPSRGFSHGTTTKVFQVEGPDGAQLNCAATICYDVCFPDLYRAFMHEVEPDFFVVASGEVFDATKCLARLTQSMTRFRAIETRRAIVRNVDGGYSGIVDSAGRVIDSDDTNVAGPVLLNPVPIDRRETLVSLIGDRPIPVGCCLLLLFWPRLRKRDRTQAKSISAVNERALHGSTG